jgi:hypothetical protein
LVRFAWNAEQPCRRTSAGFFAGAEKIMKYSDVQKLSEAEIIARIDRMHGLAANNTDLWLAILDRRQQTRLANQILYLTVAIFILTVANVVLVAYQAMSV